MVMEYTVHPVAALFPPLNDEAMEALATQIGGGIGQGRPILLRGGQIIVGADQYAACEFAGREPWVTELDIPLPSLTLYILKRNWTDRPDLTLSTRTAIAVEAMPFLFAEGQTISARRLASEALGVSLGSLRRALEIHRRDRTAFDRIRRGEALSTVLEVVRGTPKREHVKKSKRVARIRELAAKGNSAGQIAQEFHVRTEWVRQLARENEIRMVEDAIGRRTKLDPNRIIRETVLGAQGAVVGLELLDGLVGEVEPAEIAEWITSLAASLAKLNRVLRMLRLLKGKLHAQTTTTGTP